MKRIAIYQRGYTREDEHTSMNAQAMSIPGAEIVNTYWDHNKSERSEFRSLMAAAREGQIDAIIAQSICRFTQSMAECLDVIKELHERNVRVWFNRERFWSTDPTGFIMMQMMMDLVGEMSVEV